MEDPLLANTSLGGLLSEGGIEQPVAPTLFGLQLAVPRWEAVITILTLGIMIIVTLVGNILVIISVVNHTPLKVLSNYFVVSLAIADLMVAVAVLPLNVAYSVLGRWLFGAVTCKIWLTADVLCCTASILNLCAIAMDRYWAIHFPIHYATQRTKGRVYLMIVTVWTVSFLICSPPLMGWNDWPDVFTADTPCMLTEEKGYIVYSSLGSFFIPLIMILFLYFKIFLTQRQMMAKKKKKLPEEGGAKCHVDEAGSLENGEPADARLTRSTKEARKKQRRHILALVKEKHSIMYKKSRANGSQSGGLPDCSEDLPSQELLELPSSHEKVGPIRASESRNKSKEQKAARTMAVIVVTFIVCWLPFFTMYVIVPFCGSCTVHPRVNMFITWLGYLNSTLNPIIYTIFNPYFRQAFRNIIFCGRIS